jgi:spore coat protein H
MNWTSLIGLSWLLVGVSFASAADPSADLFKPSGPVPKFKINLNKENLELLKREPRKYVRCEVKVGDKTYQDVAIHIKGAAGSSRGWDDKPALTLNFDMFVKDQNFYGLDKIHLNNSVQDGSYLNELICGEMALAAGLPASRATHAIVELNGRKVGFYVLKEGFNKGFLKRHFENSSGNLYDGGFLQDIDAPLKLDSGKANDRKDLKALVEACREGDADKRWEKMNKVLDVDRMITNAVLQTIATDWDGYCRNRNNYRVYFDPKTNKAVFIPHGMDQMFQNPGDGLWHGWGGMATRAVLETPEGKKQFIAKMKEFTEKYFVLEKLYKRIDELLPRGKEALEAYQKGAGAGWENEVKNYKERLKQRSEFIKRELPKLK